MSFLDDTFVGKMPTGSKPMAVGTTDAIHEHGSRHDGREGRHDDEWAVRRSYGIILLFSLFDGLSRSLNNARNFLQLSLR